MNLGNDSHGYDRPYFSAREGTAEVSRDAFVNVGVASPLSAARSSTREISPFNASHPRHEKNGNFTTRELGLITGKRTACITHKTIDLDPLTCAIMDTSPFQRLRNLKQLGCVQHLYKDGTHNRFQHSLGVAFLADQTCRNLQHNQPLLNITTKDRICIKIAGLCHDLGHGPFSHIYDGELQKRARKSKALMAAGDVPPPFCHEEASLMMFDAILKELGLEMDRTKLDEPLKQIGDGINASGFGVKNSNRGDLTVLHSRDIIFIKECILGEPLEENKGQFLGRSRDKEFLYDIVSNRHSGLDVDKLDYFMRDTQHCLATKADFSLLIEEVRVARALCTDPMPGHQCRNFPNEPNYHLMTVWPDKLVVTAMGFFKKRMELHKNIYTHRKVKCVEHMIVDILEMAMPYLRLEKGLSILQAVKDPEVYVHLDDSIIERIQFSDKVELKPAQDLIKRLKRRDLYKFITSKSISNDDPDSEKYWNMDEEQIKDGMVHAAKNQAALLEEYFELDKDIIIVEKLKIHHGKSDKNPVDRLRFLSKAEMIDLYDLPVEQLPEAKLVDDSNYRSFLPHSFQDRMLRIFCKKNDPNILHSVHVAFEAFISGEADGPITTLPYSGQSLPVFLTQDDSDSSGSNDEEEITASASKRPNISFYEEIKKRSKR